MSMRLDSFILLKKGQTYMRLKYMRLMRQYLCRHLFIESPRGNYFTPGLVCSQHTAPMNITLAQTPSSQGTNSHIVRLDTPRCKVFSFQVTILYTACLFKPGLVSSFHSRHLCNILEHFPTCQLRVRRTY